ncbi:GNAT family N-acetyltransferase [Novosphingobium sp.]|uniref:GNAT family N-acetyltransferase n=1 Tax=Novosphingobium sp. TaxID=1874826 RepID=UPI0028A5E3D4|nr:GNAT family N-acetyltransferase [Novosphingobium sp.]
MADGPTLETQRLRLRPPVAADFEAMRQMFRDPRVTQHIGGSPLPRADAWVRFQRDVGHWTLEGFGQFTVLEKASGRYVGKLGHARFLRDLGPRAEAEIEMTWTLASGFHGQGYGFEAACAALDWFDALGPQRTACIVAEANLPSLRLAAKLGFREIDRLSGATGLRIVLARDAPKE